MNYNNIYGGGLSSPVNNSSKSWIIIYAYYSAVHDSVKIKIIKHNMSYITLTIWHYWTFLNIFETQFFNFPSFKFMKPTFIDCFCQVPSFYIIVRFQLPGIVGNGWNLTYYCVFISEINLAFQYYYVGDFWTFFCRVSSFDVQIL